MLFFILIILFNIIIYNYSTTLYILAVFVVNLVASFLAILSVDTFMMFISFLFDTFKFLINNITLFLRQQLYSNLSFIVTLFSVNFIYYLFYPNLFVRECFSLCVKIPLWFYENIITGMFKIFVFVFFKILNIIYFLYSVISNVFCLVLIDPLSFLFQYMHLNVIVKKIMLFYAYPHGRSHAIEETADTVNIVRSEIVFSVAALIVVGIWLYAYELIGEEYHEEDFDLEIVRETWYASVARHTGYLIKPIIRKPFFNYDDIKKFKNEVKDFLFLFFYPLIVFFFKALIFFLVYFIKLKSFIKEMFIVFFKEFIKLQLFLLFIIASFAIYLWSYLLDIIIFFVNL